MTDNKNSEEVILSVDNLSKKFCRNLKKSLIYGIKDILSEICMTAGMNLHLRPNEFWAVNEINFKLNRGDAIGLVGANGSGKTTLLRMISGLIKPNYGQIEITGRVVPLIALGAGFNPVLTGRENIYVNLAILGLNKREIDDVLDEVINFAEINDALDSPVQTYSSGMAARLGFSCAVHAKADILLIDEVLSVGDMRFRAKCYRKLANLREQGTTFILVSHNTSAILSMCNKAIYLSKGKQVMIGDPSKVMPVFEEELCLSPTSNHFGFVELPTKSDEESSGVDITSIALIDSNNIKTSEIETGKSATLKVSFNVVGVQRGLILTALIREISGESENVLRISSDKDNKYYEFDVGPNSISFTLPECCLKPGLYNLKISLHKKPFYVLDAVESFMFKVISISDMNQCLFYQKVIWAK